MEVPGLGDIILRRLRDPLPLEVLQVEHIDVRDHLPLRDEASALRASNRCVRLMTRVGVLTYRYILDPTTVVDAPYACARVTSRLAVCAWDLALTTSFGGTSPVVLRQKAVRSEMGYMACLVRVGTDTHEGAGGEGGGGERGNVGGKGQEGRGRLQGRLVTAYANISVLERGLNSVPMWLPDRDL